MIQSMATLVLYTVTLICLMQYSEAKYYVTILGKKQKFTPRLFGVSTFVYNNEMYAYGGQTGLSFGVSNNMYKYSFDLKKNSVSMEVVDQAIPGPSCTSCGAVMISQNKMLILTHENASKNDSISAEEVVKPYTFDLRTKIWSVPAVGDLPRYDEAQKHVFVMRRHHSTILGSDGCVYVIGGQHFFNRSLFLQESWYYDPNKNEYGVLSDNRLIKTRIHSSSINLPDGNIGVLFGYNDRQEYFESSNMSIINTQTKAWQNDYVPLGGVGPQASEEITAQTDNNNSYAYFFGGRVDNDMGDTFDNTLETLDLRNNRWLETINRYEIGVSVKPRYFASSAIIDSNFITVFGTEAEDGASEMGDLDIASLPEELKDPGTNPLQNVTVTWLSQLDQSGPKLHIVKLLVEKHRYHISAGIIICVVLLIPYIVFKEKRFIWVDNPKHCSIKLNRRAGELHATVIYRIIVQFCCAVIFGATLGYLSYNTINSSISDTEEWADIDHQTLPDIRFCYLGHSTNESSLSVPYIECQYEYTEADRTNCTVNNIEVLSNMIHVPSFPQQQQSTTCYMYKSSEYNMPLTEYNPTVRFSHIGNVYNPGEAVFVQFYEPSKNPNRVLFFDEDLDELDVNKMDEWKDSERRAGTSNDVMNHILLAYPESDISVQYEISYRKAIDVDNMWNYFGVFPAYIEKTELSITHNDAIERVKNGITNSSRKVLGSIRVTPNNFQKRIITEKRDTTIINMLGNAGGVFSVLFGFYVFLFGTSPFRPWGIVQESSFISSQKEKKYRHLLYYFNVEGVKGLPLVSAVNKKYNAIYNKNDLHQKCRGKGMFGNESRSSQGLENNEDKSPKPDIRGPENDIQDLKERLEQLEGRNQVLELVLKAYYVDDEIFCQLEKAIECKKNSSNPSAINTGYINRGITTDSDPGNSNLTVNNPPEMNQLIGKTIYDI